MATIMEVQARLTGNSSGMVRAFQEGEQAADRTTRTIQDRAGAASKALDKMALPAAAIGAGAGAILKDMGNLASEAEQNMGAVESVFKEYAGSIKANSDKAAQSLGISKSEYQKYSSVIGSQLKNLGMPMEQVAGSTDTLITKGADLASMFGGDTSQAVEALSSLLRGETDPIERYGISIKQSGIEAKMASMGLGGLSGEAEKNAKLTATMALIQEQSADATGNFAREANTAAGAQQRATAALDDAKTVMGEALLPIMTMAAQRLQWLSGVMLQHKDIIVPMLLIVTGLAAGVVGLAAAFHVVTAAMTAWTAITKVLSMTLLGTPVGWILLALVGIGAAFVLLWKNVEGFRNFWMSVWDGAVAIIGGAVSGITGFIAGVAEAVAWLWDIFVNNDFTRLDWLSIEEDESIVNTLFTIRENIVAFFGWLGEAWATGWAVVSGVLGPIFARVGEVIGQVFAAIPGIIQGFLTFMGEVVLPIIGGIFQAIGATVMWLWTNIFQPAFGAIGAIIGGFVSFFVAIWPGISNIFSMFGAIVMWLWNGVIVPAFQGIMTVIGFMVGWFLTYVWPSLSAIFMNLATIVSNVFNGVIIPLIGVLGTVFFWLLNNVIAPVFNFITGVIGAFVGWFIQYVWPVIQSVIGFIGNIFFWLMNNVIGPVFGFILGVISGFIGWLATIGAPMFQSIFNTIGGVVTWLWEAIISPVFNFIGALISGIITGIVWWFTGLIAFWNTILAPAIRWLYETIIKPIFDAIGFVVGAVIAGITWWFNGLIAFFNTVVAPVIRWLYETIFKPIFDAIGWVISNFIQGCIIIWNSLIAFFQGPVAGVFNWLVEFFRGIWNGIGEIIRGVIDWIRWTIFEPFLAFFRDTLPGVFQGVKDALNNIWNGIKEVFAGPVRFVVNTVLNDGIIGAYNKLNDIVSLPDIPRLNLGFASGGYTGDGGKYEPKGVVHGGEYVLSKAATSALRREHGMGFLHGLNKGQLDPSMAAFSGPGINHFKRNKQANVKPLGGINIGRAAGMWDGAAGLGVKAGQGVMAVHTSHAPLGGILAWADMQQNSIKFATDGPFPGYSPDWKTAVAAHEIGHTLGLEHINNRGALMNPIVAPGSNPGKPTGIDIRALQSIYPGGSGSAGEGGPNGGGDGGGRLGDGIRDIMQGLKDSINKAIPNHHIMKDFGIGIIDKVGNSLAGMLDTIGDIGGNIVDNVKGLFGAGVNRWRGTAEDALKRSGEFSEENLNSLMRRMKQESDGNDKAVNNWDSNATKGTPSKGLMQLIDPTFAAYRDKSLKNDIFDPLANIMGSINYTKSRYGNLRGGWDRKGGYSEGGLVPTLFDEGGLLPTGLTLTNNQSGRPERILTGKQEDELLNGGGFNGTVIVMIGDEQIEAKLVRVARAETDKALANVTGTARRSRGIPT